MKSRKMPLNAQQKRADELLKNEIIIRKECLKTAKAKVDALLEKIEAGDTSKKTQKELAEQQDIARGIIAWVQSHEKTA